MDFCRFLPVCIGSILERRLQLHLEETDTTTFRGSPQCPFTLYCTAVTAISHWIRKFPRQKAKSNINVSGPTSLSAQIEVNIIPVLRTGSLVLGLSRRSGRSDGLSGKKITKH